MAIKEILAMFARTEITNPRTVHPFEKEMDEEQRIKEMLEGFPDKERLNDNL